VSVWSSRRTRALALASESHHAAEILRCYADVTDVQESIATRVPSGEWMAVALATDANGPVLRLGHLPPAELVPLFADFVHRMTGVGTEVMSDEARRLASADRDEVRAALDGALGDRDDRASSPPFHVRAFVEVVATTLAGRLLPAVAVVEAPAPTKCRVCGSPPIVATLRDLPGALGSGGLVCSRCGSEQRVRRLTCAHCGEANADRLRVHSAESVPHVRIDECGSCRHYIKTVDLRRRGDAVPVVEDLATPELDLWAQDRGLTKGRTNLLGL
jgi:formate dehydrogenase accessory protein FdhE